MGSNLTHEEVFGHLQDALFTTQEAMGYLGLDSIDEFKQLIDTRQISPNYFADAKPLFSREILRMHRVITGVLYMLELEMVRAT